MAIDLIAIRTRGNRFLTTEVMVCGGAGGSNRFLRRWGKWDLSRHAGYMATAGGVLDYQELWAYGWGKAWFIQLSQLLRLESDRLLFPHFVLRSAVL